jgi:hypothetical protein
VDLMRRIERIEATQEIQEIQAFPMSESEAGNPAEMHRAQQVIRGRRCPLRLI